MSNTFLNLIPRVRSYLYTNLNWPTIRSVCFRLTWFLFVNLIDLEILVIQKYNSNEITVGSLNTFCFKIPIKDIVFKCPKLLYYSVSMYFLPERENVFPLNGHLYRRIYTYLFFVIGP